MKYFKHLGVLILLILLPSGVSGRSSVWSISDGHTTFFLGGTIHLLREEDYPLPKEYQQAYKKSSLVVFESNLSQLNTMAFGIKLSRAMVLPRDSDLSSVLNAAVYEKLKKFWQARNYSDTMFDRMRPWGAMMLLTQLTLHDYGINQQGVDAFFDRKMILDGKKEQYLETPDEQLAIMESMADGDENTMVLQTLDELQSIPEMTEKLMHYWKSGDVFRLENEMLQPMKNGSASIYQKVVVDRNLRWYPTLKILLKEKINAFVLVGTLHLVGKDGLLEHFHHDGYTVKYFGEE